MKKRAIYCPILLNITGKRCVVVGGGQVALRKVRMLLEHGAEVVVISPQLCPELSKLAESGEIRVLARDYLAGDLEEAFIAIAATDSKKTNRAVAREAKKQAVLVNVVDEPEISDFIVPSHLRRGDIAIAISTSGRSPALARKIRTRLEKEFGEEYAALAMLISAVRLEIKKQGIKLNGDAWQKAIDLDLMIDLLKKGDSQKAKDTLLSELKRQQGVR